MNAYIVVEGKSTEPIVYQKWLSYLAPQVKRVNDAWSATNNNYYLFSGEGIPSIFKHIANAVLDINAINKEGKTHYDYLLICIDQEESTREEIVQSIKDNMQASSAAVGDFEMHIFIQKVCIETWFLGNRKVVKQNPESEEYRRFLEYYNVQKDNPEHMDKFDEAKYSTKAKFHLKYLKTIFAERKMRYGKSHPEEVCRDTYLRQLVSRYKDTGDISSFGDWYEFVIGHFV